MLPPFPVVILNEGMLGLSDQAAAVWLHTNSEVETLRKPTVAKLVKRT